MATISKIKIPNGTSYDVLDANAVNKDTTSVQCIAGGLVVGKNTTTGVSATGIGRIMFTGQTNPLIGVQAVDGSGNAKTPYYIQALASDDCLYIGPTSTVATKFDGSGNLTTPATITASKMYGAVWNDYAEYRICKEEFKAGQVVCENGDDTLSISKERLQPGASIVSDTFGFAIGETKDAKCPIAVSGRVLAYSFEDRNEFSAGDAVCAGPNGTVSKMTREEIINYPERIVGTVSAIPEYENWGAGNVIVDNRIWIKIK